MTAATVTVLPPAYPLSAIVGQEALREALLVCAVDPGVGGVLVRGQRGTAKSTAVRGLAAVLPGEAPLVEVPLGTTLDRLVGALDLGRALAGEAAYEPGLLVRADGGILYVDEVNLLPDHLVDALLDAAATGVCRVEREAVSVVHDARFRLVGTMNVEEGELRPQLLDRFGLGVEVLTPADPDVRAEVVRRRLAFEADRSAFAAAWAGDESELRSRIAAARAALPGVVLPERELLRITGACAALALDGVRGDVVCARTARVLAALDGAVAVDATHVRRAALLALPHRRHRDPLAEPAAGLEEIERAVAHAGRPEDDPSGGGPGGGEPSPGDRDAPTDDRSPGTDRPSDGPGSGRSPRDADRPSGATDRPGTGRSPRDADRPRPDRPPRATDGPGTDPSPHVADRPRPGGHGDTRVPAPQRAALGSDLRLGGRGAGPAGRRDRGAGPQAGAIDSRPAGAGETDLAVAATLRAAATVTFGSSTRRNVTLVDLRAHVRAGREGALLVLVVDTSGSMAARARLARVKGALLDVLRDAYARRDRVAVVAFRDAGAAIVAGPGAPPEQAAAAVRALPAGGATPLAAGLEAAAALIRRERTRDPARRALCVVLTDGRTTGTGPGGAAHRAAADLGRLADVHVVDTEDGPVRLGLTAPLAVAAGATVTTLTTRRAA